MRVPILNTEPPPEFGELTEMPEFHDTMGMDRDYTYVPGFSELRRTRDIEIGEVVAGRRSAKDVTTLPVNFRWSRCQSKGGQPDSSKVIRAGNRGYVAVTKADIGEGKLIPSMPAGAAQQADGTIRRGVQVPIFADGPDGVADNIALDSGFDDGIESGPTFGPDGRIVITVGSYERSATRVLVFDADKKAVLARSAELPIASVEKPSDPEVCVVRTPNPPIVAADGTVFVFSELDTRVFALDPSLGGRTLSVPIGAACASSPHTGGRAAFMTSAFAGTSTARGSSPQLSWI